MNGASLPPVLQLVSGALILATGAFLVAAHPTLNALAARRAPGRAAGAAPWLIGAYLALWFAIAVVSGDPANFVHPAPLARRLLSAVVGFAPMLLALALLFGSRTLRALNSSMNPEWLIRLQAYRMGGLMFLFPFLAYGLVPAAFAWPAFIGDFVTGFAAPFVASAIARRRPGALAWAIAWNVFGMIDLVVAPTTAILSNAPATTLYPMALIPLFIGPPMGMLTHVCSLRNLAAAMGRHATRPAVSASEALGAA